LNVHPIIRQTAGIVILLLLAACKWSAPQVQSPGTTGTIETDEVHVASRYGGRVERVLVHEGESLKAGDTIAELDAAELRARRDRAAAQLADLKAGARKEEIASARSDIAAMEAEFQLAGQEEKRVRELFSREAVSATDMDRATSRVRVLTNNIAAARSRLELLLAGPRPDRVTEAQAQIEEIETQLREMRITAPTNCVVEVLNVKAGDVLTAGREAATLLLSGRLWVRVYVPESAISSIQPGQKVAVKSESQPARHCDGVVEQIARAAEFTPRNVQTREERIKQLFGVKVRLEGSGEDFRAGMSVEVIFPGLNTGMPDASNPGGTAPKRE
jgi:HlyD family secretion protein